MFRKTIGGGAAVLATVLSTGVAAATPPYGIAIIDNLARGPAVGSGKVTVTPGTGAYIGSFTIAPGSSSGWRAQPGLSMLAVTDGSIQVTEANGCAVKQYTAPEVAVIPKGAFRVEDPGNAQATFVGYFDNLTKDVGKPLVAGAVAKAPAGCGSADYHAAATAVTATELAHGLFASVPMRPGRNNIATAGRLNVPEGGDVLMLTATVAPGTSSGWVRHASGLAFLTKGVLDTYEATDSGCAKVEEFHAGDVVSHAHHDVHLNTFAGSEPAEVVLLYWGMGNSHAPLPGIANFAEAYDFTPMPPAGCTAL